MKLTIEKRDLVSLASTAVSVVERRHTIPILGNVKLSASDDKLSGLSTDMDTQIETHVPAVVENPGEITVSARMLADIAKGIKDGALVSIDVVDQFMHIHAGRSKFKLATLPVIDFPVILDSSWQAEFTLPAAKLANALGKSEWASSVEDTRYYLKGVALQRRNDETLLIATDGHRLAKFRMTDGADFPDVIIPSKVIKEWLHVLSDGDVTVKISETKTQLVSGSTTITGKVIDGTFPDWTRVIPDRAQNSVTASSVELKDAIRRAVLVATERTRAVKLSVSDDALCLSVKDQSGHAAEESVDVVRVGIDVEFGINSAYGLSALDRADKGEVTIYYSDSMSPLRVEYGEEPDLIAVLMPMRM